MPRLNQKFRSLYLIILMLLVVGSINFAAPVKASPSVPCQSPGGFRRIPGYFISAQNASYIEVVTGDFNSDGNLDMAALFYRTISSQAKGVTVFLGNGTGGFAPNPIDYAVADANTTPADLKAGDFNGDGKLDLISVNGGTTGPNGTCISTFSVLFGVGNGTFQNALTYNVNLCTSEVEVADFDSNGKDDVLVRSSPIANPQNARILLGLSEGNGFFGGATLYVPNGRPDSLAVGDFNGDGKKDVVAKLVNSNGTSHLDLYLNDGTGGLQTPTSINNSNVNYSQLTAADVNGDGKADVAGYASDDHLISVYVNNGSGAFTRTDYGALAYYSLKIASGDFNGDGKVDIASATTILYGDGMGGFTRKDLKLPFAFPNFAVGDFNGDGKSDFARMLFNSYLSQPFADNNLIATFLSDCNVPDRKKIDYDGDWKTDMSVWRPSTGEWIIRNSIDGSIRTQAWGNGSLNDQPVPGDYDGDGKADLAVFRGNDSSWYILNSSDNTVRGLYWGTTGDKPVPADYDGDGKIDVAVFRPSSGTWYVLRSSDGSLYGAAWGTNGDKPVPADFDGDYKADLAIFRPSTGYWYIFRSSDNTYVAKQWGLSTDKPVPGDYDSDGLADLMVYRPSTGLWWLSRSFNGATRAISVASPSPSEDQPVPGDYDGDGTMDIAIRRPSINLWRVQGSSYGVSDTNLGMSSDVPATKEYPIE
jgi:hypothetical protein